MSNKQEVVMTASMEEISQMLADILGSNKVEKPEKNQVTTPDMTPEEKKAARNANARFKTIKERLILEAFGIKDKKELKTFLEQYVQAKDNQETREFSEADDVKNKKSIVDREYASDKERNRSMLSSIGSLVSTIAMQNATVSAAMAAINAALPGIGTMFSAVFLAFAVKRYFKATANAKREKAVKDDDYEKSLIAMVNKINAFKDVVNRKKDELLSQLDGKKGKERDVLIKQIAQEIMAEVNKAFGSSNEANLQEIEGSLESVAENVEEPVETKEEPTTITGKSESTEEKKRREGLEEEGRQM